MSEQQQSFEDIGQRAFVPRRSALHEIHHAIGRAKRIPRTRIRIVHTGPERITWYECPQCGTPARLDSRDRRCTLCRTPTTRYEWVRPDIARALARARRRHARSPWVGTGPNGGPARYAEIADAHPRMPLPDGEYRIMRKSRGPG